MLPLLACVPEYDSVPSTFTDGGEDRLATSGVHTWTFDAMPTELFDVHGDWQIRDGTLAQRGRFASGDFPRMLLHDLSVEDFHLSVRCKSDGGEIDRACGLMFRAIDSDNYYVTRANALEDNIRVYGVLNGQRQGSFASVDIDIDGEYHQYEVDVRGTHIEILWDGNVVISVDDDTLSRGGIGVWTKADSQVQFDDLTLEVP